MGPPRQRLAAHAAGEALHMEDQARHPHHQVRAADLLHATRALHPEDPLVVDAAVELEVAYKTRSRQHRAARRAREALLVVTPLGDSHHVLVGDRAAAADADRLQEVGLRLNGNGRLCRGTGKETYGDSRLRPTVVRSCALRLSRSCSLQLRKLAQLLLRSRDKGRFRARGA